MTRSEAGKLGAIANAPNIVRQHNLRIVKYLESPKLCNFCEKVLEYEKRHLKFCSRSCSVSSSNKQKSVLRYCQICKRSLTGKSLEQLCCGSQCSNIRLRIRYIEAWLSGTQSGGSDHSVSEHVCGWLKSIFNGCSICKSTVWQDKPIPLIVDHIDGNPYDHSPANLRLVCGNCDMQLPTYKARNKGRGRQYRRQYRIAGVV